MVHVPSRSVVLSTLYFQYFSRKRLLVQHLPFRLLLRQLVSEVGQKWPHKIPQEHLQEKSPVGHAVVCGAHEESVFQE